MNHSMSIAAFALFAGAALAACDRPTVVAVPAAPVVVPVPGPAGPTGAQGATGNQGETGKTGDGTTLILVPPAASAPAN